MLQRFSCISFLFKPPWVLEWVQNEHALIHVFPLNVKFLESYDLGNHHCRFSYAGNWELVKSIVGAKFRRSHVCSHSQARNRL